MKTGSTLCFGLFGGVAALGWAGCGSGSSDSAVAGVGGASASTSGGSSSGSSSGTGGATASSSSGAMCPDADADGVTTCQGDCNDGDATVFPGHAEICGDAKDNDCNNTVDDGCQGLGTYVSTSTGNDANPGTQAMPVQTIAVGIMHAQTIGNGVAVYVAKGHYPENVVVVEGISLHGGFDPATWALDPKNNDTAILSQGAAGVYADKTVTRKTVLDGFRLQGADNQAVMNRGSAITLDGASPTLSGNVINGPNEGAGVDSHAVLLLAPSNDPKGALLTGNTITGGTAGNTSFGIAFRSNTFPLPAPGGLAEMTKNVIKGGIGASSFGIACFQCGDGVLIKDNDVTAGTANGGESSGITVSGNPLLGLITVDSNRVNADAANVGTCPSNNPQSPWCNGIDSMGAKALIVNNVVFGVNAAKSAGVWLRNAEGGVLNTVILNANYLDGGGSPNVPGGRSAAVVLTLTNGVAGSVGRIRNDILAGGQGAQRFGVFEDSPAGKTCTFEKLENDDFFLSAANPSDVLYRTWSGAVGANVNTIAAVNALNAGNAAKSFVGNPTADATFHLKAGSPCIDSGTATEAPATDFEGDSRPKGAGFDVGADER